jgi:hypothetical protein
MRPAGIVNQNIRGTEVGLALVTRRSISSSWVDGQRRKTAMSVLDLGLDSFDLALRAVVPGNLTG